MQIYAFFASFLGFMCVLIVEEYLWGCSACVYLVIHVNHSSLITFNKEEIIFLKLFWQRSLTHFIMRTLLGQCLHKIHAPNTTPVLIPAAQHLFRYVQSVYRLGLCSPDPYYEFQRLISHTSGVQSTLQPPTTLTLLHQYVTNVEFDFQQLIIGHFWSQVLKLGPKDTLLNHWWAKWPLPWFWPSPVPILVFPPEVLPTVANRVFTLPREHILTKHVSPSPATTQWNF